MTRFAAAFATLLLAAAAPDAAPDAEKAKSPPDVVHMSDEQQHTIKLSTVRAERRAITEPVRVPGTIAFDEGHVAVLRPLAPSRVVRLLAQPGDKVRAGQVLADLQIPSLVSAQESLASAHAGVREAEAGVAVARDALRRGEILARDGSLARAEAERRRLVLAQANAAADAARARVSALQSQVDQLNPAGAPGMAALVSPIAGVVVTSGITPGEFIDSTGSAFTVADLSVVLVIAQVPEASATMVTAGDPARVSLAGGGRSWEGQVVALGASLDPQSRTVPARIELANADGALRQGMFVSVVLTSDRDRENVVVPSAAVQLIADKRVAFVPLGDGRFQSHELVAGVESKDWTEVRKGLSAGDEVVTQGSFELKALLQKALQGDAG